MYLEIKKGKKDIKALDFQQHIGGMNDLKKITIQATKRCGQLSSNETLCADIWFRVLKTAEEANVEGVDYCGPVKTIHKGFLLANMGKSTKEWPGGAHFVMNITLIVPDYIPLISIR